MKDTIMRTIVKVPGEAPRQMSMRNELEPLQKFVEGYIEVIAFKAKSEILMIINEEGKLQGMEPNFPWGKDLIVGPAIFVAHGEHGEFRGLTDGEADEVMGFFNEIMRSTMFDRDEKLPKNKQLKILNEEYHQTEQELNFRDYLAHNNIIKPLLKRFDETGFYYDLEDAYYLTTIGQEITKLTIMTAAQMFKVKAAIVDREAPTND